LRLDHAVAAVGDTLAPGGIGFQDDFGAIGQLKLDQLLAHQLSRWLDTSRVAQNLG